MPPKKSPGTGPAQKVIALFSLLLFSGRPHSLQQLAGALGCSKQSILRMLDQIEFSKWLKIDKWTKERQMWYQARPPRRMPTVALTAESLSRLLLCRDMVWHMLPTSYRKEATQAIYGASSLLPESESRDEALASYTQVKPKGMIDYSTKDGLITDLLRAIREQRICDILYCGPNHPRPRTFTVAPYQIVVFHEGLYLRCRPETALGCGDDQNDIILAVHRMRGVEPMERCFAPITAVSDPKQLAGAFGLTRGKPFRVKIRIEPGAAMYVAERVWSDDQRIRRQRDGGLILEFTSTSEVEIIAWVLSFGAEAELLAPDRLRVTIHERLQIMTKRYAPVKESADKVSRAKP